MRDPLPDWPVFGMAQDVRPALRQARQEKKPLALATLVAVEGGGPRPQGSVGGARRQINPDDDE